MPQSAFIVRPFGRKPYTPRPEALASFQELMARQGEARVAVDRQVLWPDGKPGSDSLLIDFDAIERVLVKPALEAARLRGETTGAVVEAGNIREDMFNRLITADLVLADISLPNPNVFYELGLRQAFRDKFTFMVRCDLGPYPFDLQTDRYFEYRLADLIRNPEDTVVRLTSALKKTLNQYRSDSPVFKLMPQLESEDRSRFLSVPDDFREEVERARHQRQREVLELMTLECEGHLWEIEGLRVVGRAQFEANFIDGAKETWQRICARYPDDAEANTVLSTVYQRLQDRTRSEQALARVTRSRTLSPARQSELRALTGRNLKAAWTDAWGVAANRRLAALRSPLLQRAIDAYLESFMIDLNNSYAGLNALTLLVIQAELIDEHRDEWRALQRVAADEHREFEERTRRIDQLAQSLLLALESDRQRLANRGHGDPWFTMLEAAVMCTVSSQPDFVAQLYVESQYLAPPKSDASMISALRMYQDLGIRGDFKHWPKPQMLGTLGQNVEAALRALCAPESANEAARRPHRIIVFIGMRMDEARNANGTRVSASARGAGNGGLHAADDPWHGQPVFPHAIEDEVRARIAEALDRERERQPANAQVIAMAGGASGGDLLFHELCRERNIAAQMYLAVPKPQHIGTYVAPAGGEWVARFNDIHRQLTRKCESGENDVPGSCVKVFSDSADLPRWLQDRDSYNVGRRAMLWMLQSAKSLLRSMDAIDSVTLIALRTSRHTVGDFGGIQYAIHLAQQHGVDVRQISIDATAAHPAPPEATAKDTATNDNAHTEKAGATAAAAAERHKRHEAPQATPVAKPLSIAEMLREAESARGTPASGTAPAPRAKVPHKDAAAGSRTSGRDAAP